MAEEDSGPVDVVERQLADLNWERLEMLDRIDTLEARVRDLEALTAALREARDKAQAEAAAKAAEAEAAAAAEKTEDDSRASTAYSRRR